MGRHKMYQYKTAIMPGQACRFGPAATGKDMVVVVLSQLNIGERAVVTSLEADNNIRRRLQDIGIIEGTVIECLMKSPFGEPRAYMIRGAVIALRKSETDMIFIKKEES